MIFIITLASVLVMAGGFIVLHFALSHRTMELKVAGWLLVIGGIINIFAVLHFAPPPPPTQPMMHMRPMMGAGESGMQCDRMKAKMEVHKAMQDKMILEAPPPPIDLDAKPKAEKPAGKGDKP